MYRGSISFEAPMLYAISFLLLFAIGGLTGLFLGSLAVDVHLHDTYFVVAHFHYVMMGGSLMAFVAGLHYWWPKMFGRMYSEKWAAIACALIFVGFNATFLTQFLMGSRGMPRRYYNYLEEFQPMHVFLDCWFVVRAGGFSGDAGVPDCLVAEEESRRARQSLGSADARMGNVIAADRAQLPSHAGGDPWAL